MKIKKACAVIYSIAVLFALSGCGNGDLPLLSVTISGPTSVPAGQNITLTANVEYSGTGIIGYSWYFNDSKINGVITKTFTVRMDNPSGPHTIRVDVTDGDVWASASASVRWE